MSPCLVNYSECSKQRCDEGCKICKHFIPGRNSKRYNCDLDPEKACISIDSNCESCTWKIPDRRVKNPYQTEEQKRTRKREMTKRWRKRKGGYQTKYKRFYRERLLKKQLKQEKIDRERDKHSKNKVKRG